MLFCKPKTKMGYEHWLYCAVEESIDWGFEANKNETQPLRIRKCTILLTALTNELPVFTHPQPKVAEIHYPPAIFSRHSTMQSSITSAKRIWKYYSSGVVPADTRAVECFESLECMELTAGTEGPGGRLCHRITCFCAIAVSACSQDMWGR